MLISAIPKQLIHVDVAVCLVHATVMMRVTEHPFEHLLPMDVPKIALMLAPSRILDIDEPAKNRSAHHVSNRESVRPKKKTTTESTTTKKNPQGTHNCTRESRTAQPIAPMPLWRPQSLNDMHQRLESPGRLGGNMTRFRHQLVCECFLSYDQAQLCQLSEI